VSFSIPDYIFERFDLITPSFLASHGIRCVLCDIDNTLVTYDDEGPTEKVLLWLSELNTAGITVIFLSNNKSNRAAVFAKELTNPHYAPAHKPLTRVARRALSDHGFLPRETAVLGDQIFTDIWTGNLLGAALTLFVPPIKDLTTPFFRAKRFLEKPFLKHYKRRENKRRKESD